MTLVLAFISLAAAYTLGAIPFGLIVGKLARGVDIREQGSHNLGATNAFRVLGVIPGSVVLLADIAKGAAAVFLAKELTHDSGTVGVLVPVLCAPAAMVGHTWTAFAGFRGGKGVAAGAGAFLALSSAATGTVIIAWAVAFLGTGYVSVGSMIAAGAFPFAVYFFSHGPDKPYLLAAALGAAVLVLVRHVPNMKRLVSGTENRALWKARRGVKDERI